MESVGSFKAFVLLLAGIVVAAGAAQAQVAAPNLNTAAPGASNPAVLMYNQASRVGGGVLTNLSNEATPPVGDTVETATGDGTALHAVLKNDSFAFGAEVSTIKMDVDPTKINPPAGGSRKFTDSKVYLAAAVGKTLAVGLGLESGKDEQTDNNTGTTFSFEGSLPLVGATWAITETVFLGGTYGSRTVKASDGVNSAEGDAAVSRLGAGIQWRKGADGFHLEAYRAVRDLLEVRDPSGVLVFAEEGYTNGLTLEVVFSNILVGIAASRISTDELDPGNPVQPLKTVDEDERSLSLGWVPEKGLAIAVTAFSNEETNNINPDAKQTFSGMFVGLSVLF